VFTPFRQFVPTDPIENLRWRARVHRRVMEDPTFAGVIEQACAADPVFFINGFCWTHDPRPEIKNPKLPFILYPYQVEAVGELLHAITHGHDLLVEKSRDVGASWLCCAVPFHVWMFRMRRVFLFISWKEEYVDSAENPKALFWKLDFLLNGLPVWLRPRGYNANLHRSKLKLYNPETKSVITGESTTGNVSRGARPTAMLLDEFAIAEHGFEVLTASRDATSCRIFNSTPKGVNNAFYAVRQSGIKKLRLHWSVHPAKNIGLYTTDENGRLKVLDPAGYPDDYEPHLDGKLRSPWYDLQCERAGSPQEIAQELDIDYLGSGGQFFHPDRIQAAITACVRPSIAIGDLAFDELTGDPVDYGANAMGRLRLWCMLDSKDRPLHDNKLIIGADVSAGTGASNSCLAGYDNVTHEKIFEYVSPYIRPEAFAAQTIAIARWFKQVSGRSPLIIWEANGPGRQFGARIMELGYGEIYLRQNDDSIKRKVSDIPGWAPTKQGKLVLLGSYRSAVESQRLINRSRQALEETLEYVILPDDRVIHQMAGSELDPSGASASHGDRVMADALAWKIMSDRRVILKNEEPTEIPVGSLAWRQKMRERAARSPNKELTEGW